MDDIIQYMHNDLLIQTEIESYKFGEFPINELGVQKSMYVSAGGGSTYYEKYMKYKIKADAIERKMIQFGGNISDEINGKIQQVFNAFDVTTVSGYNDSFGIKQADFAEDTANKIKKHSTEDYATLYSRIDKHKCIDSKSQDKVVIKNIEFGNPGDAKKFNNTYYSDINLSDLPRNKDSQTDYTYAVVNDKYTNKYEIRFGRIDNFTEIGGKHSSIIYNDDVYVTGELSIRWNATTSKYDYHINVNSSKMDPLQTKILDGIDMTQQGLIVFGWNILLDVSNKIFKKLSTDDINIIIDNSIDFSRSYKGGLFRYYLDPEQKDSNDVVARNICPSDEFMEKYNKFGEDNKVRNACIEYTDNIDRPNSNIILDNLFGNLSEVPATERDIKIKKCKWDN